jgi:hypothetical protein
LDKRKVIERHLQTMFGQPFRVVVAEITDREGRPAVSPPVAAETQGSQPEASPVPPKDNAGERAAPVAKGPQSRRDPAEHPVVKKVQEAFDARIVNIYEEEKGTG